MIRYIHFIVTKILTILLTYVVYVNRLSTGEWNLCVLRSECRLYKAHRASYPPKFCLINFIVNTFIHFLTRCEYTYVTPDRFLYNSFKLEYGISSNRIFFQSWLILTKWREKMLESERKRIKKRNIHYAMTTWSTDAVESSRKLAAARVFCIWSQHCAFTVLQLIWQKWTFHDKRGKTEAKVG